MVETDGKTKNCQISLVEYQMSDLKLSNVCDTHPHSMDAHSLFSLSLIIVCCQVLPLHL